jgi:hypothetical protein
MFNPLRSRSLVLVASTAIVGVIAYAGYGSLVGRGSGSAEEPDTAAIRVEASQLFVTIENRAGMPLFDVSIAIVPVGRATVFTTSYGRMENGEKRDISLGDFHGRDGTRFNLRAVRPRSIRVTARDMTNNMHEVEVPWKG